MNDGHGDFDFDAPDGHVTGYVLASVPGADFENCTGPGVPGAQVFAETSEQTVADDSGHFEFWVVPGKHLLGATADDFMEGAGDCEVLSNQSVFCCIYMVPMSDDTEVGPWHDEEDPLAVGCSSTGHGTGIVLLPLLALLILFRRRKTVL